MWRFIVITTTGGYVFGNGQPERPLVFVKRSEAKQTADEFGKEMPDRTFRVKRVSTKRFDPLTGKIRPMKKRARR